MAVTVNSVIKDIFSLWGIENPDASVQDARNRAMNDLNAAVQMVWQNPEKLNYFSRDTITVTVEANTGSIAIPPEQNLLGPVRLPSTLQALDPIDTKYEFENYATLYFDDSLPPGPPVAYYLDREGQSGPDAVSLTLKVVPEPTEDTDIELDVITVAPAYTWTDYCAGSATGTPIPLPHGYGESLLLPIARKSASSYFLFFKEERRTSIEEDYQRARLMLGIAAPEIEEAKPDVKPPGNVPWVQRREK